jgi:hypothetical protein
VSDNGVGKKRAVVHGRTSCGFGSGAEAKEKAECDEGAGHW